jgi:hypothetical protein
MRLAGQVERTKQRRNAYRALVRKHEEKERERPLATLHCGREDDIKMDLKFVGWEGVDWIHVAESSEK